MMHSATAVGPSPLFGLLAIMHVLASLSFASGLLLLAFWAYKQLTVAQLKKWGVILVVAGALIGALTIGAMHHGKGGRTIHSMKMHGMNGTMMNNGKMGMSMDAMSAELKGKTGDDFDAAFIAMMIPHHQGAIDMAELAAKNAKRQEIKDLASAILAAQQKEIGQMEAWEKSWGFAK